MNSRRKTGGERKETQREYKFDPVGSMKDRESRQPTSEKNVLRNYDFAITLVNSEIIRIDNEAQWRRP
ncbi:hypothetical protein GWI33_001615 [Rhynchophorus ferrugineus]|uniref:Uncharacterized protein n=1 Tax=Rhynchophorus ferrugineus TaxID=354439 RepID=A0A834IQA4_RHYFE|nr:hypothetical protein GWI33_001615 [Rhynchophorus ferrugineus]